LVSCTGEPEPDVALFEVGAVEGYVLVAGQGQVMTIAADRIAIGTHNSYDDRIHVETQSDSTGWYRLELPTGRYTLDTRYSDLGSTGDSRADTVQIEPSVLYHELRRGQVRVRVRVPPEWEARSCYLGLKNDTIYDGGDRDYVEDGWVEFEIQAVEPGSYVLSFSGSYSNDPIYLPGSLEAATADTLVVGLESTAVYEADFTNTYATISGRVTGSRQVEPALSMSVTAFVSESRAVSSVLCDDDGRFVLVLPFPLDVRLRFDCNSTDRWHGGDSFAAAAVFALQAGDRLTGVDAVEGGLEVWLEGPGDLVRRSTRIRIRDEAGNILMSKVTWQNPIRIGNLEPGRVLLQLDGICDGQTWAGQWYDGAASSADATPIDVAAGVRRRLDVSLVPGGRIAGAVLEAGGADPGSVQVALCDEQGEPWCSWPSYAGDGAFAFSGLADGDYYLYAELGGDVVWWYPGSYGFGGAAAVTIVDHGAVTGLSWTLPALAGGSRP
ncbi:MAG: hypothetical protein Q7W29_13285, partial [bacterium]|nr:hypothetical protein [bacterium]